MNRQPPRDSSGQNRSKTQSRRPIRLVLESLEARRLLAGINVSVLVDQDGSRNASPADSPADRRVVFLDLNNNARQDTTEPVAFTNELGIASFEDLAAGDYSVGLVSGNSQSQTFPVRVDEAAEGIAPAATHLIASADLSQIWAFDNSGKGELVSAPAGSRPTVELGGPIVSSLQSGDEAWIVTAARSGSARSQLTRLNLTTGSQQTSAFDGVGDRFVSKIVQAGSTVVAQLTGPRGVELATVKLSNGVAVLGASASVPGLVTIAGSPSGEIAVLQSNGSGSLSIYAAETLGLVRSVGLASPASDVAFDAAGRRVLVAGATVGVNVYNNGPAGLSLAAKLAEAASPLLTQSKDGRFVTGSRVNASEFIVWDAQSWQPVGRTRLVSTASGSGQDGSIVDARMAASGDRLVATSQRGTFVSELADATIARVTVASDEVASVQLGVRVDQLNRKPNTAPVEADLVEDRGARGQLRTAVQDEDGDTLWFRLLASPANGKLNLAPTGDWTYQPSANFNGSDRAVVRVFDGQAYSDLALVFDVAAVNDPPEKFTAELHAISEAGVAEDDSLGFVTVFDADLGARYTFEVSDPRFVIRGGQIFRAPGAEFDFETEPNVELEIIATEDAVSGYQISTTATLSIADVNEPPTAVRILNANLPENSPGALIGQVAVSDPENASNFSFVVSDSRFMIENGYLRLKPGVALDFEQSSLVNLSITASDGAGSIDQALVLAVSNVNDLPTGMRVAAKNILERTEGAPVGRVSVDDQDGELYRYTVSDDRFEVVDGLLKLKDDQSLDRRVASTVQLTVTAISGNGDSVNSTVTVPVAAKKSPYQNPVEPRDVNGDGRITPLDALILINHMNSFGPGPLGRGGRGGASGEGPFWVDVNGDGVISPLDVLLIINWLNRRRMMAIPNEGAEGEGESTKPLAGPLGGLVKASPELGAPVAPVSAGVNLSASPTSVAATGNRITSAGSIALQQTCSASTVPTKEELDAELESLLDQLSRERSGAGFIGPQST